MEYIKITAKTVNDAVIEAAIKLETSSDNIEYKVIEHEKSGFLGFGSKPAVIEARIKEQTSVQEEPKKEKVEKAVEVKVPEIEPEAKPEVKEEVKEEVKVTKLQVEKPVKTPVNIEEAAETAKDFLEKVLGTMGMDVEITSKYEDENLNIEINGNDMGILIGKRGQTLDSLQYLTSLVVNKGKTSYLRVKLDTENYRNRRKVTLENLAKNIAFKVKKTRRPVFLEPMNPYERRIIHAALQNDPYVTTHSEGEEPCRKVVVTLKKQ